MKKIILTMLALCALNPVALASPASDLFREASFYLEFYYNGYSSVSAKDLGAKYGPQLDAACKTLGDSCGFDVARGLIARMLAELNDGHTYLMGQASFANAVVSFSGVNPDPRPVFGFTRGPSNERGELMLSEVRAGSAAEQAGLQPGDRIVSVNDRPVARASLETLSTVKLSLRRGPVGNPQRLELALSKRPLAVANLPYSYAPAGAPQGVFVLRFPSFVGYNDIGPRAHELLRQASAKNARAIVVDLRGNGGGEETECTSAVAAFTGSLEYLMQGRLQTFNLGFKDGSITGNDPRDPRFYRIANPANYLGPMAVLTDGASASCAELFAYFIQKAKRGPVIGTRTQGVLNTATDFFQLIDRSALAITYVRTLNSDGTPLPEFVLPDVEFRSDSQRWASSGVDPQLGKALEVLGIK